METTQLLGLAKESAEKDINEILSNPQPEFAHYKRISQKLLSGYYAEG